MNLQGIKSIKRVGERNTLDLEVDSGDHNFIANGIVVSNSHARGYAQTTALSVYLKFTFPKHFFLEALKMTSEKQDPSAEVADIVKELPYFQIKLLPPSLTKSTEDFSIEGDNLRFGLKNIKGISEKSIAHLQSFIDKEKSNLFQVFEAASQSKLNVSIVSSLIELGCLEDVSPYDRQKTVLLLKIWKELTPREKSYCLENGEKYNFDLIVMLKEYLSWTGANGKLLGKESRLETIRKKSAPFIQIYRENIKNPMVSQYLFEKKLLGYCPSTTLSDLFREYDDLTKINAVKTEKYENELVKVMAEVVEVKTGVSKKNKNKYAKITVSDETGSMNAMIFSEKWENYLAEFGEPKEGQIIYIRGKKSGGEDPIIFTDHMSVQFLRVYERISDLKGLEKEEKNQIEVSSD
jgi:DNA polymerase III alpha subunit